MSHSPAPLGSSRFVPSFSLAVVNRNFSLGRDSHAGTPRAFPWAVRSWMTLSEGAGKVLPQVGFPSSLCGKPLNRRNFLGQLAIVPHKRRSVEGSCYRALRPPAASVLWRGQGLPPLSPLAALFLRCAPDRFSLTKPNTSGTIELPASLRSDGVRDHPGMPFGFPSECAFSFVGISTHTNPQRARTERRCRT
jgi:hypothetical protein